MKKIMTFSLMIVFILSLCACSKMPFNGPIEFHEITLTVPERFVRDSTQSKEDLWVFEHGNYSEYIIISRKDITGEAQTALRDYVDYMKENGAESEMVSFLNDNAVHSTYYQEEEFCQELLFAHNNAFYAVALRGGDQKGFEEIVNTIGLLEAAPAATI